MTLPFQKKAYDEPIFSRWNLLWACLFIVAVLLFLWEMLERTFFSELSPAIMHWVYLGRDVLGATVTTLIAVKVVLHNWEKANREIIKRDRFLASIVDNSGDAIMVLDGEGHIFFWNRAAENMLGYQQQEAVGQDFQFLSPKEFGYTQKYAEFLKAAMHQGLVRDWELEEITKGGKRLAMSLTGTLIKDQEAHFLGILILMRDITHKKMLQEKMVQSDRVAAVGQLAASIAHEIGTPLNVISGNAEYLLGSKEIQENSRKELTIIMEEAERISKLIKRLMHITQPQTFEFRNVQINAIVQRVLDFTRHAMDKARIALQTHFDEHLVLVLGDEDQLVQVILNIIMNAIEAMPDGGSLYVSTSSWYLESEKKTLVQLRVEDTGVGIPKEIMPKIFDPFFSTKNSRGSTGLGLSISYRILEDHKGAIKIDSTLGKGTVVTIRFPGSTSVLVQER